MMSKKLFKVIQCCCKSKIFCLETQCFREYAKFLIILWDIGLLSDVLCMPLWSFTILLWNLLFIWLEFFIQFSKAFKQCKTRIIPKSKIGFHTGWSFAFFHISTAWVLGFFHLCLSIVISKWPFSFCFKIQHTILQGWYAKMFWSPSIISSKLKST